MPITDEEIRDRFDHHPPTNLGVANLHGEIRQKFGSLAVYINQSLDDGREKSLCLTALEESMHWANTSIAKEQTSK